MQATPQQKPSNAWKTAAAILWCVLLLVVTVVQARGSHHHSVLPTYSTAGADWIAGRALYHGGRGFVYGPLAAVLFAPLSLLPPLLGNFLWRLVNVGALLGGVGWWLKAGFHRWIVPRWRPLVFILLLPMAIGNLYNGQVNPLIIGLILIAVVAASRERWMLSACCIAAATYFKIYPLAIGLLLVLVYPKEFSWRLILALLGMAALTFVLQRPGYVLDQYRLWWATRAADNRLEYGMDIAPRDLWMLFRLAHIRIGEHAYMAIQLASAALVGMACLAGKWRRWPESRLMVALLSLGCSWMLLCGPSTESATYIVLGPAVVLALVDGFNSPRRTALRFLIAASFAVLLGGLAMNSFMHLKKTPVTMSVQPAGAVLFLCYSALLIGRRGYWETGKDFASGSALF